MPVIIVRQRNMNSYEFGTWWGYVSQYVRLLLAASARLVQTSIGKVW